MAGAGVVNADKVMKKMKFAGISNAVEDVIIARDIMLAKDTGAALHLCHCSTKDSVRLVELAKQEGIRVTAEACPHHFTLTSEDIPGDDATTPAPAMLTSSQCDSTGISYFTARVIASL